MNSPEEKRCLYCEKLLSDKMRRDAKFCNTYCRTAFNNRRRSGVNPDIVNIDKVLHRNFELLQNALKNKEYAYVDRDRLRGKGFNFDYFTQAKGEFRYCYTLCYKLTDDGKIKVRSRFDSIVKKFE